MTLIGDDWESFSHKLGYWFSNFGDACVCFADRRLDRGWCGQGVRPISFSYARRMISVGHGFQWVME
jgi:hypothetical protein